MGIVTTYICDISGKQGNKDDFVSVKINATSFSKMTAGGYVYPSEKVEIEKFIHKDVAEKLKLLPQQQSRDDIPTPTFESQLTTLLKDYIADLVYDEVAEAVSNKL